MPNDVGEKEVSGSLQDQCGKNIGSITNSGSQREHVLVVSLLAVVVGSIDDNSIPDETFLRTMPNDVGEKRGLWLLQDKCGKDIRSIRD